MGKLYNHRIDSNDSFLEAINSINKIQIKATSNTELLIIYNVLDNLTEVASNREQVYDLYIQLLRRDEPQKIEQRNGSPISVQIWLEIEGQTVTQTVYEIVERLNYDRIVHLKFDKNRILVEYFHGILLLEDKLKILPSNVIPFKNVLQTLSL